MSALVIIIIAVVFSCLFSFVLRMIDKDNNSMEKVKRYADKRKADFDVYFADKVKQLKIHSAELDGEQQQAVAAVNRLEKQIGVFNEMIASLEKDTNAVHDIHEKILKYGNQITDLSKMTSAVEENLLKIKNESNFVGKVHDKLEESKSDIEKIKKEIKIDNNLF